MFEFIKQIFDTFVYLPQLNLLYFLNKITGDIGVSIFILAIAVNILLWPVIVTSYISGQKMRILGPKIKEIQSRYKTSKDDEPAKAIEKAKLMQAEIKEFYKKHNIKTSVFLQVVFLQIFFASGVFYVVNNVSQSVKDGGSGVVSGIYNNIFGVTSASFPKMSLGFLDISLSSTTYIILPLLSMILSYLYGMYSFKWAPNTKLPEITSPKVVEVNKDGKADSVEEKPANELGIDPAAIQRNQEFMIIYVLPIITFAMNASFSVGLNLYFLVLSLFNLIRHIIITQYYAKHVDQLFKDMANSDPEVVNKDDEFEVNQNAADMALDQAVAVEVIKKVS